MFNEALEGARTSDRGRTLAGADLARVAWPPAYTLTIHV